MNQEQANELLEAVKALVKEKCGEIYWLTLFVGLPSATDYQSEANDAVSCRVYISGIKAASANAEMLQKFSP